MRPNIDTVFDASRLENDEIDELLKILNKEKEKRKADAQKQAIEIFRNAFYQLEQIGAHVEVCTQDGGYEWVDWNDFSFKF